MNIKRLPKILIILLCLSHVLMASTDQTETKSKKCPKNQHLFNNKCIKIPKNSIPSNNHPGWDCGEGFIQKRFECIKLDIPKHAIQNDDGNTWRCKEGYEPYRGTCRKSR